MLAAPVIGSSPPEQPQQQQQEQQPMPPLVGVVKPHFNDVLCGRGVATNRHIGNENFRSLVNTNKEVYVSSSKKQKMTISRSIVQAVRSLDPPGRFLERDAVSNTYYDIGDKRATEKTSQALRDGAAKLRKQLSQDLQDSAFLSAVFDPDDAPTPSTTTVNGISAPPKKKAFCRRGKKANLHRRTQSNPLDLASNYTDTATMMWNNWQQQRQQPQQQQQPQVLHDKPLPPATEPLESSSAVVHDTTTTPTLSSSWDGDALLAAEAQEVLLGDDVHAGQELMEDLQNPALFCTVFDDDDGEMPAVPWDKQQQPQPPVGPCHGRTRSDGGATTTGNWYNGVTGAVSLQDLKKKKKDTAFLSAVFEKDNHDGMLLKTDEEEEAAIVDNTMPPFCRKPRGHRSRHRRTRSEGGATTARNWYNDITTDAVPLPELPDWKDPAFLSAVLEEDNNGGMRLKAEEEDAAIVENGKPPLAKKPRGHRSSHRRTRSEGGATRMGNSYSGVRTDTVPLQELTDLKDPAFLCAVFEEDNNNNGMEVAMVENAEPPVAKKPRGHRSSHRRTRSEGGATITTGNLYKDTVPLQELTDLKDPAFLSAVFEEDNNNGMEVAMVENAEPPVAKKPRGHRSSHRRTRSEGGATTMGNLYNGVMTDAVPLQELPDLKDPAFLSAVFEEDNHGMTEEEATVENAVPLFGKPRGHCSHRRTRSEGGATTTGNLYNGVTADAVPLKELPDLKDPAFLSAVFEEDNKGALPNAEEEEEEEEEAMFVENAAPVFGKPRGQHRRTQSNPLDAAACSPKSFDWQEQHPMDLELPALPDD